jgi:hypothetical protein
VKPTNLPAHPREKDILVLAMRQLRDAHEWLARRLANTEGACNCTDYFEAHDPDECEEDEHSECEDYSEPCNWCEQLIFASAAAARGSALAELLATHDDGDEDDVDLIETVTGGLLRHVNPAEIEAEIELARALSALSGTGAVASQLHGGAL